MVAPVHPARRAGRAAANQPLSRALVAKAQELAQSRARTDRHGGDDVDADADAMATDAVAALADASSGAVKFGYYTSVVMLANENAELVDAAARDVLKAIHHTGFGARIEDG
jgi:type IV secretory pathway VirB4 component